MQSKFSFKSFVALILAIALVAGIIFLGIYQATQ